MRRKTVDVEFLVQTVNELNRKSTCSADQREGWNALLELILHKTGQYKGFGYYTSKDVPPLQLPGIIRVPDDAKHKFPDKTRRFYYGTAG